jgi:hypothetical protein
MDGVDRGGRGRREVAPVAAVVDQGLGEDPAHAEEVGQSVEPGVVPVVARRDRQERGEEVAADRGAAAGDEVVGRAAHAPPVEEFGRPRVGQVGVGDDAVVDEQARVGMLLEGAEHALDLLRQPDVVLVAEKDDVAAAGRERPIEVQGVAEPTLPDEQPDGEGGVATEGLEEVQRPVRRAVVRDHELVGAPRLLDDAAELRLDVRPAVEGGHRHGDGGAAPVHRPILTGAHPRAGRVCTASGGRPEPSGPPGVHGPARIAPIAVRAAQVRARSCHPAIVSPCWRAPRSGVVPV